MRYRLGVSASAQASVPHNEGTRTPNPVRRGRMTAWHPSAGWLVMLVIVEFGAYLALRQTFRHAHGG